MHKSIGYLEYDPVSPTTRFDPWWLIIRCDDQLAALYQSFVYKDARKLITSQDAYGIGNWLFYIKNIKLTKSVWGSHISVIRGEEPPNKQFWKKYQGKEIEFSYIPMTQTNGCHYWLPVSSSNIDDIRLELGLPAQPLAPFHLTIGCDNTARIKAPLGKSKT